MVHARQHAEGMHASTRLARGCGTERRSDRIRAEPAPPGTTPVSNGTPIARGPRPRAPGRGSRANVEPVKRGDFRESSGTYRGPSAPATASGRPRPHPSFRPPSGHRHGLAMERSARIRREERDEPRDLIGRADPPEHGVASVALLHLGDPDTRERGVGGELEVEMTPGATAQTRTPCGPTSSSSARVSPISAPFADEYAVAPERRRPPDRGHVHDRPHPSRPSTGTPSAQQERPREIDLELPVPLPPGPRRRAAPSRDTRCSRGCDQAERGLRRRRGSPSAGVPDVGQERLRASPRAPEALRRRLCLVGVERVHGDDRRAGREPLGDRRADADRRR